MYLGRGLVLFLKPRVHKSLLAKFFAILVVLIFSNGVVKT